MTWHILDVGSIWVKEFASALSSFGTTLGWLPEMGWFGAVKTRGAVSTLLDPPLNVETFPLQRGYSRFPISLLAGLGWRQTRRMAQRTDAPENSPLICTTPFYAPVAERWPGPTVYYQTDLTTAYAGIDSKLVRSMDTRMCQAADAVCPNSRRVAQYLVKEAGCEATKITIVPNATRGTNVLPSPASEAGTPPEDLSDLPRPIIGVLGNLAANLDWCFLLSTVEQTPSYSWAFVGPTDMPVPDSDQRQAREQLMKAGGRVRFTGSKSYRLLQQYARCLDAAVLPYRRREPTFSGSSTRFYEHLAACRPILATKGFEELLDKEPLLTLVDSPQDLLRELNSLRSLGFRDGFEELRWQSSLGATWHVRAATLMCALQDRWPADLALPPEARDLSAKFSLRPVQFDGQPDFQLISG